MATDPDTLLVLRSDQLHADEPDLGHKLTRAFLTMLLESGTLPSRVICMTRGIFLTTEGSPVLDLMQELERQGSEIHSCGTCLDYYSRADKLAVGKPGNMRDTVKALQTFKRVIQP